MQKKLLLSFGLLCVVSNSSASFYDAILADKMRVGSCVAGLATMLGITYGMKKTNYIDTQERKSVAQVTSACAMLYAFNNALGFKITPLEYAINAGVAGVSFLASTDKAAEYVSKVPFLGLLLSGAMKSKTVGSSDVKVAKETGHVGKLIRFVLTGGLLKTAISHFYGV